jgi:hypothetical protein
VNNYEKYYELFKNQFFKVIKEENQIDEVFGVLNPFYIVIYHNNSQLLNKMLKQFGYNISYKTKQMTPFEYCFLIKRVELVKIFCKFFKFNNVKITRKEYDLLLDLDLPYSHDALSNLISVPEISNLPYFKYFSKDTEILSFESKFEIVKYVNNKNSIAFKSCIS